MADELKCKVCDQPLAEGDEVVRIENTETKEVVLVHRLCLDKVGTA